MSQNVLELRGILNRWRDSVAEAGGVVEFRGYLNTIYEVLKDGKFTNDDFEPCVGLVEELYDDFVAPVDIPGIPNSIEPMVDALVRRGIRPAVRELFDRFVGA